MNILSHYPENHVAQHFCRKRLRCRLLLFFVFRLLSGLFFYRLKGLNLKGTIITDRHMRSILLLIISILLSWTLEAQISADPAMPVASKAVTLTFKSALESRLGLYTADLYAHTGVIVEGKIDWQHVIGQWMQNEVQPRLTYKGDGIYELVITPDITTFYSVAAGEKVKKLAFVFRSADGSRQTNDLFVDVFEEGLAVDLTGSFSGEIFDQDKSYSWVATTSAEAQISIRFGNEVLSSGSGKTLSIQKTFTAPAKGWLVATARSGEETAADSVYLFVREATPHETLPAGSAKGIRYPDQHTARLVLWAPGKSFVFVIGDFNNWTLDGRYQMNKDNDTFWIDITGLESGKEYAFQYYIDGTLKIADPYSAQISDPWNDSYINAATYPGLLSYPDGKASGVAAVLQPGREPYQWTVNEFTPPDRNKLIIYELLVRDFTSEHTWQAVIGKLDYLSDLRINVLELMPVNEFEGNSSWGYNTGLYFAPDKYYGPREGLKRLVDECHKRGIAVVLDMVLNHSYGMSPFVQMYMDNWTVTSDNPWYNISSNFKNSSLSWGYDFNHDAPATRELVDSINSFWMNEYRVDGFRFDFTKGFSNTPYGSSDWGSAYDPARIANLKRMADEIRKRNPGAYIICEHLADNSEEKELADYGLMLWGNMNYSYSELAKGNNADISWGLHSSRGWQEPNLVAYMESHDEERVVYAAKTSGINTGSYNIRNLAVALQRQELNSLFLIPLPGPKMIWQFGELGYDYSINLNGRTGEKPVLWSFTQNSNRARLFTVMASLNYLKQLYGEFTPDQTDYSLSGSVKWYRLSNGTQHIIAVGNFGTTEASATIQFPKTGTWYDYFEGTSLVVDGGNITLTLQPGSYKLFTSRLMDHPEIKVSAVEFQNNNSRVRLYPNPVDRFLMIESDDQVPVEILTINGKLIRRFDAEAGTVTPVDMSDLAQGIYLAKVKGEGSRQNIFKVLKQ